LTLNTWVLPAARKTDGWGIKIIVIRGLRNRIGGLPFLSTATGSPL
jgi:hypothetical protein